MAVYQRGSKGPEVLRIQSRLAELGINPGPIDGIFGGSTEVAVRAFQQREGLQIDGRVGSNTWAALFNGGKIETPSLFNQPLAHRCLALTGAFETDQPPPECFAGLSGDFDGQGISFGVCQWNLGQGSLQPMLEEMNQNHTDILLQIFDQQYPEFVAMLGSSRQEQLAWARSIQNPKHVLIEPWRGQFRALGRRPEFQGIQGEHAAKLYEDAQALCVDCGVFSGRAVALMFDIKVQNGSISKLVKAQIGQDFSLLDTSADPTDLEVARLRIIANRRAEAANSQWVEDVRARKLAIANGAGLVHGNHYNLAEQYGITLEAAVLAAVPE